MTIGPIDNYRPCCPTCGSVVAVDPAKVLYNAPMSNNKRRIVDMLLRAYPRSVRIENLIEGVYGDSPNGGPDAAAKIIQVQIHRLRNELPKYGWTIPYSPQRGGRGYTGIYKLEQVTA